MTGRARVNREAKSGTRVIAWFHAKRDLSLGEASAIERAMLRAAVMEERRQEAARDD